MNNEMALTVFSQCSKYLMFVGDIKKAKRVKLVWNSLMAPFCVDYKASNTTFLKEIREEWGGLLGISK